MKLNDELRGQTESYNSAIIRCFHKTSRVVKLRKIGFQLFPLPTILCFLLADFGVDTFRLTEEELLRETRLA
jgi:hypothetical protein